MKKLICGLALACIANAFGWELETGADMLDLGGGSFFIYGSDDFPNFWSADDQPWRDERSSIKSIESSGVPIGTHAFEGCTSLESVKVDGSNKNLQIRDYAFKGCTALKTVTAPAVDSFGRGVFEGCTALKVLFVKDANVKRALEDDRSYYGIGNSVWILVSDIQDQIKNVSFEVVAKVGGESFDKDRYLSLCEALGMTKSFPQLVKEGEIAVTQAELQAAKAEAVSIADGVVSLAVGVCSNGNFQAETKSWKPVELKNENVAVKDGRIVISIPVSSQSGFMILQSGDAKVGVSKAD